MIQSKWVIFKCLLKYLLRLPSLYLISKVNKGENSLTTKNLVHSDYPKIIEKNFDNNRDYKKMQKFFSSIFCKLKFLGCNLVLIHICSSELIKRSIFPSSITIINYEVSKHIIRTLYCLVRTTVKYWLYLGDCSIVWSWNAI